MIFANMYMKVSRAYYTTMENKQQIMKTYRQLKVLATGFTSKEVCRTDLLILFALIGSSFTTALLFFFGVTVSAVTFVVFLVLSGGVAALRSWRSFVTYLCVLAVAFFATAYSFAYDGWDPATCHWPMAQAMIEGWNPVLNATIPELKQFLKPWCNYEHILCAPKFPAICAAMVSCSTRLFSGMMFANVMVAFVMICAAIRFFITELKCAKWIAIVAAGFIAIPGEILNYLVNGTPDCIKYWSVLGALFSLFLWLRSRKSADAVAFWLLLSVVPVSKTTGIVYYLVLSMIALFVGWRDQSFRRLTLFSLVFIGVVGASPYLTEWIHGGSPFFPGHTFDSLKTAKDLTSDFIKNRNADALKMGYFARFVYAWVSQDLAVWATKAYLGAREFNPVFNSPVINGIAGCFNWFLWGGVLACLISRNRRMFFCVLLIIILCNLTGTKYMGYKRYFPEIYAVPTIALMTIANSTRMNRKVGQWVRSVSYSVICVFTLFSFVCFLAWTVFHLELEVHRQAHYDELAGRRVVVGELMHNAFSIVVDRRMRSAGLIPVKANGETTLDYSRCFSWCQVMMPGTSIAEANAEVEAIGRDKPIWFGVYPQIGNAYKKVRAFNWKLSAWPDILFQPKVTGNTK